MASTLDLPTKSTRQMNDGEIRAEARKWGIGTDGDINALRRALKAELDRRWKEQNRESIEGWNRWIEKNGLPLAKYRVW